MLLLLLLLGLHAELLPEQVPVAAVGAETLIGSAAGAIPVVGGFGVMLPLPLTV